LGRVKENAFTYEINEAYSDAMMATAMETTIGELDVWDDEETQRLGRPYQKRDCYFVFHMRPGVKWHDGQPVSVRDVEFTYSTIQNTKVNAPSYQAALKDVVNCEVLEGDAVAFTSKKPFFEMFWSLAELPTIP